MAELDDLGKLNVAVKSRILENIQASLVADERLRSGTMYTKSDGTNYGMYQKSDDLSGFGDLWERVFSGGRQASSAAPQRGIQEHQ